jgi:hypothetical protein
MTPASYNQGGSMNNLLTDSINIELHNAQPPYELLETTRAELMTDGTVNCQFMSPSGTYYIVIRHRNTITTWSAAPVFIASGVYYDFSSDAANAYGYNMTEVEPNVWALLTGDLNDDENVDLLDLSLLENDIYLFNYGYLNSDINGDGNVDLLDPPIMESNVSNFVFSVHP